MDKPPEIFQGTTDIYNGVKVDSETESDKNLQFPDKLEQSLEYWRKTNRRGIWFKVHTQNADWVHHLVKEGFDFHHAKTGYVMMFKWLPENESANIPEYPHTMIGVGGVVINAQNEILVVSEKYALIPNSWKLPGGYVEPNENFIDAVIREVNEETGIDTEYESLLSIRHGHGGRFGCSDLYIVIGLTPKTHDLQRCEREIAKVQWMPIDVYLNHPNVHETNRHFVKTYINYKEKGIKIDCKIKTHEILKKIYNLYTVKTEEEV